MEDWDYLPGNKDLFGINTALQGNAEMIAEAMTNQTGTRPADLTVTMENPSSSLITVRLI